MKIEPAPDAQSIVEQLLARLDLGHVKPDKVVCTRSFGAKSRALARIWAMPRIWQVALGMEARYVIEVLSQNFDELSREDKEKTLLHELLHIPKTFSGALVPHTCFGREIDAEVEKLYEVYLKNKQKALFELSKDGLVSVND